MALVFAVSGFVSKTKLMKALRRYFPRSLPAGAAVDSAGAIWPVSVSFTNHPFFLKTQGAFKQRSAEHYKKPLF